MNEWHLDRSLEEKKGEYNFSQINSKIDMRSFRPKCRGLELAVSTAGYVAVPTRNVKISSIVASFWSTPPWKASEVANS